jgi:hypothetical protein
MDGHKLNFMQRPLNERRKVLQMMEEAKILEILKDAFGALDDALGDSDFPVETDEEERETVPVQYAARLISGLIQELEQPRAAQLLRAPERSEQDGGLTLRLIHMVNFLGNVIVDSFGKGYIAENDLNQANDYLDYVIPLLPPS